MLYRDGIHNKDNWKKNKKQYALEKTFLGVNDFVIGLCEHINR